MNPLHFLLPALIVAAAANAQDTPPAPPSAPAAAEYAAPQAPASADTTVKRALPASPLPASTPPMFTQDDVRKIETGLKKEMMFVGMGSGVLGLLVGMMIGRRTTPPPTSRRF